MKSVTRLAFGLASALVASTAFTNVAKADELTLCWAARSTSNRSRSSPVALRGPLGPGLGSANRLSFPDRSSVAIWCTEAVE